mgnify:FL=1
MDAMKIFDKLKALQKDKKLSNRKLCELAGVSHSVLDNWKKRKVIPSVPILSDLCAVLGISLSQLFSNLDVQDLSEDEQRFLDLWSTLDYYDKKILFDLMRRLRK